MNTFRPKPDFFVPSTRREREKYIKARRSTWKLSHLTGKQVLAIYFKLRVMEAQ